MVIAIICDASHVLKLIRNMLQNKGMVRISKEFQELWEMITDEVRWEVIEELVKFQEKFELKIAPKLNEKVLKEVVVTLAKWMLAVQCQYFQRKQLLQ